MTTIKLGSKGEDVKTLLKKLNCIADGIFGQVTEEAVKEFLKTNGLIADGIVGDKTWEALGLNANSNTRNITEIIIHCSATPEGKDYTVSQIREWHLARGFKDIGYHYVIYRDGSINVGRLENVIGAHCTGHNSKSIGICYIGGMDSTNKKAKDTRTDKQKESLIKLLKLLKSKYPKATIHGHREFANKDCPSFDAKTEYANIK